ncbi:MAG: hypothetical protein LBH37_03240 [Oscillospiraceae bacterium]|nr:hypothetical protein [Oscillospiraceae bacterium]
MRLGGVAHKEKRTSVEKVDNLRFSHRARGKIAPAGEIDMVRTAAAVRGKTSQI